MALLGLLVSVAGVSLAVCRVFVDSPPITPISVGLMVGGVVITNSREIRDAIRNTIRGK